LNPKKSIKEFLDGISGADVSFRDQMNATDIADILNEIKLEEFNRYVSFVKRFSFETPAMATSEVTIQNTVIPMPQIVN
jgi:hypothetical protein